VEARKLELHFRGLYSVHDNFRAAVEALHYYNVAKRRRNETTYEEVLKATSSNSTL
jgi:hypothetical protein